MPVSTAVFDEIIVKKLWFFFVSSFSLSSHLPPTTTTPPPNVPIRTITPNLPLWRQQRSIMGPPAWFEGAAMLSSSVGLQIDGVCLWLRLFAQRGAEGGSTQMVHTSCELPQSPPCAGGNHKEKRLKGTQWPGRRACWDIRQGFPAPDSMGNDPLQGRATQTTTLTPTLTWRSWTILTGLTSSPGCFKRLVMVNKSIEHG